MRNSKLLGAAQASKREELLVTLWCVNVSRLKSHFHILNSVEEINYRILEYSRIFKLYPRVQIGILTINSL